MRLPAALKLAFPARPPDADKRSVGTVAVFGGCRIYPHAPVVASLGARAAGAGLVRLVAPVESLACAGALVPEATFTPRSPRCEVPAADVLVIGMGLGRAARDLGRAAKLLSAPGRFVVDADALFALGASRPVEGREIVLTPHEGEAARLLGWSRDEVASRRLEAVRELAARYGATAVLKGRRTLVASADGKRIYENETGNPNMALGGMGDLLAGVLGARWAYLKGEAFLAAASAVWLHGAAADKVAAEGRDPSLANTAAAVGELRSALERRSSRLLR